METEIIWLIYRENIAMQELLLGEVGAWPEQSELLMMSGTSRLKLTDKKVTCGSPNLAIQFSKRVKIFTACRKPKSNWTEKMEQS